VQAVRPRALLPCAARHGVCLRLRLRAGEHVVAGTTLAWIWRASPADPAPDPAAFARVLDNGVRIGFERTLEQDAAFGIRQLVDVACKALSPAVNDPYTAVHPSRCSGRWLGTELGEVFPRAAQPNWSTGWRVHFSSGIRTKFPVQENASSDVKAACFGPTRCSWCLRIVADSCIMIVSRQAASGTAATWHKLRAPFLVRRAQGTASHPGWLAIRASPRR